VCDQDTKESVNVAMCTSCCSLFFAIRERHLVTERSSYVSLLLIPSALFNFLWTRLGSDDVVKCSHCGKPAALCEVAEHGQDRYYAGRYESCMQNFTSKTSREEMSLETK